MSQADTLCALAVIAVAVLGTCAIVALRGWTDRINAERAAAVRRIEAIRGQVGRGVRHSPGFTLNPVEQPHGKETHVSTAAERSENRG